MCTLTLPCLTRTRARLVRRLSWGRVTHTARSPPAGRLDQHAPAMRGSLSAASCPPCRSRESKCAVCASVLQFVQNTVLRHILACLHHFNNLTSRHTTATTTSLPQQCQTHTKCDSRFLHWRHGKRFGVHRLASVCRSGTGQNMRVTARVWCRVQL
jgi:hypothetical protein